jgi:hypothetical protein
MLKYAAHPMAAEVADRPDLGYIEVVMEVVERRSKRW